MNRCCFCMILLLIAQGTAAIELSDLPSQASVQNVLSDFSKDPTQYLEQYTEQPAESSLMNENSELVSVNGVEKHESAKIIAKSYQEHSSHVSKLQAQTARYDSKTNEELNGLLKEKYSDCHKTVQCSQPELHQENDFKGAATNLAVVSEASHQLPGVPNEHTQTIFQGQAHQCRKYGFGFLNCCRDSGWGQFMSECSQEEIALRQAREKGIAIFLGTKKTGSRFKKKKYDVYCVFDSKLAKIVQEQGRFSQLHFSFGNADSPNCRGISASELSRIDFDRMDLMQAYFPSNNIMVLDQKALTANVAQNIQNKADAKK